MSFSRIADPVRDAERYQQEFEASDLEDYIDRARRNIAKRQAEAYREIEDREEIENDIV